MSNALLFYLFRIQICKWRLKTSNNRHNIFIVHSSLSKTMILYFERRKHLIVTFWNYPAKNERSGHEWKKTQRTKDGMRWNEIRNMIFIFIGCAVLEIVYESRAQCAQSTVHCVGWMHAAHFIDVFSRFIGSINKKPKMTKHKTDKMYGSFHSLVIM